jgi:hypothetical protein
LEFEGCALADQISNSSNYLAAIQPLKVGSHQSAIIIAMPINPFDQIPDLKVKTYKSSNHAIKSIEGRINLSSWQSFQSRRGPYNSIDGAGPSDGNFKLMVDGDASAEEPAVTTEQINAYKFLVDRQESIKENILDALLAEYKNLQNQYGYSGEDEEAFMPNVTDTAQFQTLIGLSNVHVLDLSKDGVAYTGFEFGCRWDEEHGLGIMVHKERVIEIGAADTAFDTWIAEKDIDPVRAGQELEKYRNAPVINVKKPWWKFW